LKSLGYSPKRSFWDPAVFLCSSTLNYYRNVFSDLY
jgi:hypothetical protein